MAMIFAKACRPRSVLIGQLVSACVVGTLLVSAGGVAGPTVLAPQGGPGSRAVVSVPMVPASSPAAPPGALGSMVLELYNPGATPTGPYDQPVVINSSRYADLIY